jgi:hypothetical protein
VRLGVFERPDRTGDESPVWDPSRVPAFEDLPAYVALEDVDLATVSHGLGTAINRPAFAGPVKRFSHAPACASDCPITSYIARAARRAPLPRPCVHLTRWTAASHTVEGVAVFRRDRLEARGQDFNEHAVAAAGL